jgi:hypothetical protein
MSDADASLPALDLAATAVSLAAPSFAAWFLWRSAAYVAAQRTAALD